MAAHVLECVRPSVRPSNRFVTTGGHGRRRGNGVYLNQRAGGQALQVSEENERAHCAHRRFLECGSVRAAQFEGEKGFELTDADLTHGGHLKLERAR